MPELLRHTVPYYRSLDEIIGAPAATLPLDPNDPVYLMAQQVAWVDPTNFAVGRWDGSVTIFDSSTPPPHAPVLDTAVSPPATGGVQMLAGGSGNWFASSNDAQSITIWGTAGGGWADTRPIGQGVYDPSYGIANCGSFVSTASGQWLVTGHEAGYLLIWDAANPAQPAFQGAVDLTSPNPSNPWGLQNIRGVALLEISVGQATFATGSENGDICLVQAPSGALITRVRYNPNAQRGINTIATNAARVVVGNCAVGAQDKNFWAFDVSTGSIVPTDSVNLVIDTSLPQVFNFSISWATPPSGPVWYAATQEGALWGGTIDASGKIDVIGHQEVSAAVGAATAYGGPAELVVAAYDVHSFTAQ